MKIWEMIDAGNTEALTAHLQKLNANLDERIEASRLKLEAEEIANGSGPIVESEWLGGNRYRIAGVRHGVMPAQRDFDSHEAMMSAFQTANAA